MNQAKLTQLKVKAQSKGTGRRRRQLHVVLGFALLPCDHGRGCLVQPCTDFVAAGFSLTAL